MKDNRGREYATLSKCKCSMKLECDDGFTCIQAGAIKEVFEDDEGLYVHCNGPDGESHPNNKHYLDGQLEDDGDYIIGMYFVGEVA